MAKKSIVERAAEAILQEPMELHVGDKVYVVAPPCGATLIMVSKLLAKVPHVDKMGNVLNEVLASAKDADVLYEIVATLIIGAKRIRDEKNESWVSRVGVKRNTLVSTLAEELKYECTNAQVYEMVAKILSEQMEIGDFFALSTSLREISLIQETREVDSTIAFGQSSQDSSKPSE